MSGIAVAMMNASLVVKVMSVSAPVIARTNSKSGRRSGNGMGDGPRQKSPMLM